MRVLLGAMRPTRPCAGATRAVGWGRAALLALAMAAATGRAGANPDEFPRTQFGLRLGAGTFVGHVDGAATASMHDVVPALVPVVADVGVRLTDSLYVGGFAQYAFGLVSKCPQYHECTAGQARLGLQVAWTFQPDAAMQPWLGVGAGYDLFTLTEIYSIYRMDGGARGFEYFNVQGGFDYKVGRDGRIGPFFSIALGSYQTVDVWLQGRSAEADVSKPATHLTLMAGMRASLLH